MVVPIIAGAGILAFVTWGEDVFGDKLFKQLITAGIALVILVILYIAYKMYLVWVAAKETGEDIVEKATQTYQDILDKLGQAGERGQESYNWLTTVTPEEFLPDVDIALGKITPGDYESTYGPGADEDTSLLRKIYWAPTAAILGTKGRVVGEAKSIHEDITSVPSRLKAKADADLSKIAKAKRDLLNAPSYYGKKLKFW